MLDKNGILRKRLLLTMASNPRFPNSPALLHPTCPPSRTFRIPIVLSKNKYGLYGFLQLHQPPPPKKTQQKPTIPPISTIPVLLRVAGQGKIRNASFKKRVAQVPRFARKWPALKTTFLRQRPTPTPGPGRWASTSGVASP